MTDPGSPLARWLAPDGPGPFLSDGYRRRPRVFRGVAGEEVALATRETVDRLVAETPCDRLAVRDGQVSTAPAPRTAAAWRDAFTQGFTLVLRHAQLHDPALAALGRSVALDLHGTVSLQLYATPAGHGSFGWHYDPEEVFFVQTVGRKRVRLRANTQDPAPVPETMARPASFSRETSPVEEHVLAPGDLVYVPGGTWHEMVALEDSVSISLGLVGPTFLDLLDGLRRELLADPRWRERLPVLGRASGLDDAGRLAAVREVLEAVARGLVLHLAEEDRPRRLLAESFAASMRSSTAR